MKKYMVLAVFAMIAIMALGMLNTGAWFTDTATTEAVGLKAGTLVLDDNGFAEFDLGEIDNVYPGWVSDPVSITIENAGSLDLAWFGDLVIGSSMLKDAIYIKEAKMEFLNTVGTPDIWETTDTFIVDGYGYLHTANQFASLVNFDGNPSMAPGTGYEHMGALKPNYAYRLTYTFAMVEDAGNEYQGAGPLTLRFKVDATQINVTAMNALKSPLGNHFDWMNDQIEKQQ